ncbi:hypothetical protein [Rickettsia endosymbiont of Ixodes pacificus]|nr:hypothetical protein [Rickettsia endosymbiont of Ixodes pacificus]
MLGYTSDMSDEEWGLIEEIINKRKGKQGRPPPKDAQGYYGMGYFI